MASAKPSYWFAAKRYGYGWGLPARWQGWVVLFCYLGLALGGVYRFAPSRNGGALILYLLILTALLVIVLAWKGERPLRWRWGGE